MDENKQALLQTGQDMPCGWRTPQRRVNQLEAEKQASEDERRPPRIF